MTTDPPTVAIGRAPPHSLEAEEFLLSCCLLDGGDTLAKCIEAHLPAQAFSFPPNRIIFESLCGLRTRGLPVAVETLTETLRTGGRLEAVGGFPYLVQVSGLIPTTAQAAYFIDRVRELYLSRRFIELATGAIEAGFQGGVSAASLLSEFDVLRDDAAFASNAMTGRLDAARLRTDQEPPELREVFTLKGVSIATPGNLVAICAQAKTGKTAFIGAMLAAAMGADGDSLGVESANAEGRAVLHFDTEQAPRDHWTVIQTALRRAGLPTAPAWLRSYGTAGWQISDRRLAIEHALRLAKREFGGVHSLFLDGVADFVMDPNDGEECFPFIDSLQALAVRFDCPIIGVLHLNPGTEKSRGHLGSQLERRAETNLILEKDSETGRTVVFSTKQRRAPILKSDGPCFRWDDGEEMHVSVETLRTERDSKVSEAAKELAGEVFAGHGGMPYSAIISALKTTLRCSEATADRRFNEMRKHKVIVRYPPNLWAIGS